MQLTVDTKKDSAEEIRKAINFLKTFLDSQGASNDTGAVSDGMFGMFGDISTNDEKQKEEHTPFNLFSNSEEKEEDDTDSPQIIPY